ncbi:MAG: hypothetical protein ACPHJ3_12780, partial [Rubripirellula sp.]
MPMHLARFVIALAILSTVLSGTARNSAAQIASPVPDAAEQADTAEPSTPPDSTVKPETPALPEQGAEQTATNHSADSEPKKDDSGPESADAHGSPDAPPMFTNDAVVLGMLIGILALVFWTHSLKHPFLVGFYKIVPMLLLCYFLPSLLTTFGIVHPS